MTKIPKKNAPTAATVRAHKKERTDILYKIMTAEKLLMRFYEFSTEHADALEYMEQLAIYEANHERRFGAKFLIEEARKRDFASFKTPYTHINNNLCAPLTRYLVEKYPHMSKLMERRKSCIDLIEI